MLTLIGASLIVGSTWIRGWRVYSVVSAPVVRVFGESSHSLCRTAGIVLLTGVVVTYSGRVLRTVATGLFDLIDAGNHAVYESNQTQRQSRADVVRGVENLAGAGTDAIGALIDLLSSDNELKQETAARMLGRLGPAARESVPELLRISTSRDSDVGLRWTAIRSLSSVGRDDPEAAASLCNFVANAADDEVPDLVDLLIRMDAVPLDRVDGFLDSDQPTLRRAGLRVLLYHGQGRDSTIKVAHRLFNDESDQVRLGAGLILVQHAAMSEPEIHAALSAEWEPLVDLGILSVRNGGPVSARIGESLIAIAPHRWAGRLGRSPASRAVEAFGMMPEAVQQEYLRELVEHTEPEDNGYSHLQTVIWLGGDYSLLSDSLESILFAESMNSENWNSVFAVSDAIGRARPKWAADLVPRLIQRLTGENEQKRRYAIVTLGRLRDVAAPAISHLAEIVNDENSPWRTIAIEALGQIGPAAEDTVPSIIRALRDTPARDRVFAIRALSHFGPAARDAAPDVLADLNALLAQPELRFRDVEHVRMCLQALMQFGVDSGDVLDTAHSLAVMPENIRTAATMMAGPETRIPGSPGGFIGPDETLYQAAIVCFTTLGKNRRAEHVESLLDNLLRDSNPSQRALGAALLHTAADNAVRKRLALRALSDPDAFVVTLAADSLAIEPCDSKPVEQLLTELMNRPNGTLLSPFIPPSFAARNDRRHPIWRLDGFLPNRWMLLSSAIGDLMQRTPSRSVSDAAAKALQASAEDETK